jgi:hypothetical protein
MDQPMSGHKSHPAGLGARWTLVQSLFLALLLTSFAGLIAFPPSRPQRQPGITFKEFARLMSELSEPEGYFDSDNFVSNEEGYLKVMPALDRLGISGGAYLGVGPDQNYSYIAEIKPELAFMIDIRRQNALEHLYYKALFHLSVDRAGYMERLFGRRLLRPPASTEALDASGLLGLIDRSPRDDAFTAKSIAQVCSLIRSLDLGLNEADFDTIRYIGRSFVEGGPDMKFTSYNRAPRSQHPTYRRLLVETCRPGIECSYLSSERRFEIVKRLHEQNRIIPIVGDLGGLVAVRRAAAELRRRRLAVSCFYLSNVEFYLFGGRRWPAFVKNMQFLPWAPNAVLVRSYANSWRPHPARSDGYYMTSLLQTVKAFLENEKDGLDGTYWDLVTHDYIAR